MSCDRVGNLPMVGMYLLRSSFVGNGRSYPARSLVELLHVMSEHAGGEVLGYERIAGNGPWRQRWSSKSGHGPWPEMDQAVADLVGDQVEGSHPERSSGSPDADPTIGRRAVGPGHVSGGQLELFGACR